MAIPVRPTFPTDRDDLLVQQTDDGSRTLLRRGTQDAFHSGCGAASESKHVYLRNSGVVERLQGGQSTSVLEVGLGTAMAMLMTFDLAAKYDTPLEYHALENDWISWETQQLLEPECWLESTSILAQYARFREQLPGQVPSGQYHCQFDSARRLCVEVADAATWKSQSAKRFDAIYYDPFCPESAAELWTAECFASMRAAIKDDGALTTYSCSRPVRDALEQSGWRVQRVPGPVGGKREVLIARPAVS
jgi:tRNA U34 5-methylaminomethyl-2-thiouridine-forming methyltransferase MnmC